MHHGQLSFNSNRKDFKVASKENGEREGRDAAKKNVASTIFGDLSGTVSQLDLAYRKFEDISEKGKARFERSIAADLERAVAQVYVAVVLVETAGTVQSFLDERGVKPHGNVKNQYTSFMQACIGSVHRSLKSALCKRAAVIALARRHDVAPELFEEWRKLWPTERACEEFRRLANQGGDEGAGLDTRGFTGQMIARVEFAANGSGKVKIIEILKDNALGGGVPVTSTAMAT
jgi:hypothetical protein